ncbi:hypothetical protein BJX65DRAFT_282431 [Aspergillus insuetus]
MIYLNNYTQASLGIQTPPGKSSNLHFENSVLKKPKRRGQYLLLDPLLVFTDFGPVGSLVYLFYADKQHYRCHRLLSTIFRSTNQTPVLDYHRPKHLIFQASTSQCLSAAVCILSSNSLPR